MLAPILRKGFKDICPVTGISCGGVGVIPTVDAGRTSDLGRKPSVDHRLDDAAVVDLLHAELLDAVDPDDRTDEGALPALLAQDEGTSPSYRVVGCLGIEVDPGAWRELPRASSRRVLLARWLVRADVTHHAPDPGREWAACALDWVDVHVYLTSILPIRMLAAGEDTIGASTVREAKSISRETA